MRRVLWILLIGSLLLPAPGSAQAGPPRAELQERVRRAFLERIRTELDLSRDEGARLRDVLEWSEAERRQVAFETRQIRLDTERFLTGGGDDAEARALLDARERLQERERALFREEQERLLEVISPAQVVRLYEMREQFVRRLQQLRQNRPGAPSRR